jgi:uncharacterized protein (DUF2236 family)
MVKMSRSMLVYTRVLLYGLLDLPYADCMQSTLHLFFLGDLAQCLLPPPCREHMGVEAQGGEQAVVASAEYPWTEKSN